MTSKVRWFASRLLAPIGYDPDSALCVISAVRAVLDERLSGARCWPPIILVIDEFTALMHRGSVPDDEWYGVIGQLALLLEDLNTEGRKHRVYALCIGQATNASRTGGTTIRDLFNTHIAHAMRGKQAEMLELTEYKKQLTTLEIGQALLACAGKEPCQFTVPYLSEADMRALAVRLGGEGQEPCMPPLPINPTYRQADTFPPSPPRAERSEEARIVTLERGGKRPLVSKGERQQILDLDAQGVSAYGIARAMHKANGFADIVRLVLAEEEEVSS